MTLFRSLGARLKALSQVVAGLIAIAGLTEIAWSDQGFPSYQEARKQFEERRGDYLRLVSLLRQDRSARFVGGDGRVNDYAGHSRDVPEYRDLMSNARAQFAIIGEDGSIEFALWGSGCALCSDSYMGFRYFHRDVSLRPLPGWTQKVVTSLDSKNLPKDNGSVADGLYVIEIEPDWFVYRFEYRE